MTMFAVILCCLTMGLTQAEDYSLTPIDGKLIEGRLMEESEAFRRVPEVFMSEMTPQEQRQAKRPAGQFYTFTTN